MTPTTVLEATQLAAAGQQIPPEWVREIAAYALALRGIADSGGSRNFRSALITSADRVPIETPEDHHD